MLLKKLSKQKERNKLLAQTLRVMKLTAILLTVVALQVSAGGHAQKVTLDLRNVSLEKVFKDIRKQTGFVFFYEKTILQKADKISVQVKEASIEETLEKCFNGQPFGYNIVDKTIVINKENISKKEIVQLPLLPIEVSGKVTDESGNPLSDASVVLKGNNKGVSTDANGFFKIESPQEAGTIVVSYVGYETIEIAFNANSPVPISVSLRRKDDKGEEIVIVGFGKQKKVSLTGAVSTIKTTELKQSSASNVSNALVGRLPGVIARQSSGEPGQNSSNIWIRGFATLGGNANNAPLILVDGVVRTGALELLDPNEIETVTVLKDASATAVFGVRGANGVILVTTRRGTSSDKPVVSANVQYAVQTPTKLPEYLPSAEFFRLRKQGYINDNRLADAAQLTDELIDKYDETKGWDPALEYNYLYPSVNWMEELLKPSSGRTTANVNVSGGNNTLKYFVFGGYTREDGIYKDSWKKDYKYQAIAKRYNFRSNIDLNITRWIKAELSLGGIMRDNNYPPINSASLFTLMKRTPSYWYPMTNPDGSVAEYGPYKGTNPYGLLVESGYLKEYLNNLQATSGVEFDLGWLVEGLSARTRFSFDTYNYNGVLRSKNYFSYQYTGNNNYQVAQQGQEFLGFDNSSVNRNYWERSSSLENYLNYNLRIKKHSLFSQLTYIQTERIIRGYDPDNRANDPILSLPYRTQGLVARLQYNYDGKYFAEFNYGYNGSENFIAGKRYGSFPAFSVGYLLSKEDFFAKLFPFIDQFKLRASYGKVGNQGNTRFAYQSRFNLNAGGYSFGTNFDNYFGGALEGQTGNPDVTWENGYKTNIGVDIVLLKNKLTITADVFSERRKGIFTSTTQITPAIMGIPTLPNVNKGEVENKGFEIEATLNDQIGKFNYYVKGQWSFARNKVINALEPPTSDRPWQRLAGRRLNEHFGLVAEGLFQSLDEISKSAKQFGTLQPGDIKYRDINGDGVINTNDQIYLDKVSEPEQIFGFSIGLSYKGFDISGLLQGALGRWVNISGEALMGRDFEYAQLMADWKDNYWTADRPDAKYPRLMGQKNENNGGDMTRNSSYWLKNGNYARLKNFEVGYTLPKRWINAIKISNLRIYANGNNLVTWDKIKLFDPESPNGSGGYPIVRTFNFGIDARF